MIQSTERSAAPNTTGLNADCIIVGGGLAGLSLSILLARQQWKVLLFEKHKYPFHRVCGEYVSLESKPFLERLGMQISFDRYPLIKRLQVTAPSGVSVEQDLDMGGFGISRFELDHALYKIALESGVNIVQQRVDDIAFEQEVFYVKSGNQTFTSKACIGSFGKRSNIDVKLHRPFVQSKAKGLNNYLGIKYHIKLSHPKNLITLHNFNQGYCGISAIEDDLYCLCYLTRANNLAAHGNDISTMEKNVLFKNKSLEKIFTAATFLWKEPLVISQVSFADKELFNGSLLFCGDAAGLITPLCGNGMSIALRSAHLLAPLVDMFLRRDISAAEMCRQYSHQWQQHFSKRLQTGRRIQIMFGNNAVTSAFLQSCRIFPGITRKLIRSTHGDTF